MAQDDPFAQLERLKNEAAEHRARVAALTTVDAKKEVAQEIWPWLEDFCDSVREMMEEQSQVLDELIDGGESAIDYELGAKIVAVFELGKQICVATEQILPLVKLPAQRNALAQLIATYRDASAAIGAEVAEATVQPGEDGEEEPVDPAELGEDDDEAEDEAAEEEQS